MNAAAEVCGDYPAPCNCDDPETHDGASTPADDAGDVKALAVRAIEAAQEIGDREGVETGSLTWWYGEALDRGGRIGQLTRELREARAEVDSLRAEVERFAYVDEYVAADCKVGHRILIDDGDGGVYACPSCALDSLRVTLAAVGEVVTEMEDDSTHMSRRTARNKLRAILTATDPVSLEDVREPGLLPKVCTDPDCEIPTKPGRPMHGPHDFRAGGAVTSNG